MDGTGDHHVKQSKPGLGKGHVFSHMWKVDPKDKFIHDDINEYTRTNIYI
jgi:hypothetical protein